MKKLRAVSIDEAQERASMSRSLMAAEHLSLRGATNSPDTQELRAILAEFTTPSDPIQHPQGDANSALSSSDNHHLTRSNSHRSAPADHVVDVQVHTYANAGYTDLQETSAPALPRCDPTALNGDLEQQQPSHRIKKTTYPNNSPGASKAISRLPSNTDLQTNRGNGQSQQVTLQELRAKLRQIHGQRRMDSRPSSNESHGSTLSTTQELDETLYLKYAPNKALEDDAISTIQTHNSYRTDDTGHIKLDFEASPAPESISNEIESGHDTDSSHSHEVSYYLSNPETPVRPSFAKTSKDMIPLADLFALTQPPNTDDFLGGNPPSSARPSPNPFHLGQGSRHSASSPLIRQVVEAHLPSATTFVSSSPLHTGDIEEPEQITDSTTSGLKATFKPFNTSSLRRNAPEPLEVYTSRKESQERRERQRIIAFNNDGDSSSDDIFQDEFEHIQRARHKKKLAAQEIAAVRAVRPPNFGTDLVEVPSTAKGRRCRNHQEDRLVQCEGADARDKQKEKTLVRDSQGRGATVDNDIYHDIDTSPVELQSYINPAPAVESKGGKPSGSKPTVQEDAVVASSTMALQLSGKAVEGPLTQPLQEISLNTYNIRTPVVNRQIPSSEVEAMVPETSPACGSSQKKAAPQDTEIPGDPPVSPSDDEIDFSRLPGFTPDEDMAMLFPSSEPVQSPPRRSRRVRKQPNPSVISSSQQSGDTANNVGSSDRNPVCPEVLPNNAPRSPIALNSVNTTECKSSPNSARSQGRYHEVAAEREDAIMLQREYGTTKKSIGPISSNQSASNVECPVSDATGDDIVSSMPSVESSALSSIASTTLANLDPYTTKSGAEDEASDSGVNPATEPAVADLRSVSKEKDVFEISEVKAKATTLISSNPENGRLVTQRSRLLKGEKIQRSTAGANPGGNLELRRTTRTASYKALQIPAKSIRVLSATPKRSMAAPIATAVMKSWTRTSASGSEKAPSEEPTGIRTPSRYTRRFSTPSRGDAEQGLFGNMAFSVSYSRQGAEKDRILKLIKQHGGRVLEAGFHELFDDTSSSPLTTPVKGQGPTDSISGNTLKLLPETRTLGFTCLVADEHSRKAKYMQALALGLPCIAGRWIEDCVAKSTILDWEPYLLAAGNSSFLNGAIRSRILSAYPASVAKFTETFEHRQKLLTGKSIILVMGKGKEKDRKKAYLFLTKALGARQILQVDTEEQAFNVLTGDKDSREQWDWIYHDGKKDDSVYFAGIQARKRKRTSIKAGQLDEDGSKRTKIIGDEYVIQSLILGKLMED